MRKRNGNISLHGINAALVANFGTNFSGELLNQNKPSTRIMVEFSSSRERQEPLGSENGEQKNKWK